MGNLSSRRIRVALAAGSLLAVLLGGCLQRGGQTAPPTPEAPPAADPAAVAIARRPDEVPPPITRSEPKKHVMSLETRELAGKLADGTTFNYWTFDGTVPGPMLRVLQGDTVELHLKNSAGSKTSHSIDLHAVTGPGGGAVATQTNPGGESVLTFKALNPGVYVYHCATPHIPTHIANGMYGLIVVEPPGGLPAVDREFYVMQGEFYTRGERGQQGHLAFDGAKLFREQPDYVVFNGQFQGLMNELAMKAKVGERIRLFVGNGGPNLISSLHLIGEIFDRVYPEGSTATPLANVQTTLIPAGGATVVEFVAEVPGNYLLVDHSISRAIDKGAVGAIVVEGSGPADVFVAPKVDTKGH